MPDECYLERRIPHCGHFTERDRRDLARYGACLEENGARSDAIDGAKGDRAVRRAENKRGSLPAFGVPMLLRGGVDRYELGEHLFRRSQAHLGSAGGAVRLALLHRHDGGEIFKRLYRGEAGDRRLILLGTCIAAVGIVVLFLPFDVPALALAAFIVVGLGCAPIYPSIIHSTPFNFGAEHSGAIIGIQMASAYVGSTFLPPLFGLLGRHIGFAIMPIWLAVLMALMIVMIETTFRLTSQKNTIAKDCTQDNE